MTALNYLKKTGHPLCLFGENYSGTIKRWLYQNLTNLQFSSTPGIAEVHFFQLSQRSVNFGLKLRFQPFLKKELRKKRYQLGSLFFRKLFSINSLRCPLFKINHSVNPLPFNFLKYPLGGSIRDKNFNPTNFFRKSGNFSAVSFLCTENYLATGTVTGFLEIYKLDKKKLIYLIKGHEKEILSLTPHPNLFSILSSSENKISRIWKMNNLIGSMEIFSLFHKSEIEISKFREEGRLIDFVTSNKIWKSFDLVKQKWIFKRCFFEKIFSIAFRRNDHLVSVGTKFNVIIFDLRIEKSIVVLKTKQQAVLSLEWTPDRLYLLNGGRRKNGGLWDLRKLDIELPCFKHEKAIVSLKCHPCSEIVFSSSKDKTTKIWDNKKFRKIYTLEDHQWPILKNDLSTNGSLFGSISNKELIVKNIGTSLV